MDFEFNLNKIKNTPRYLAEKAFWVTLILVGIAVLLGLLLGYKYTYRVKQTEPEVPTLTRLNQGQLEDVLERLEKREGKFNRASAPSYNLFEAD